MYLVSDCGSRPDSALHGERSKESWHDVQLLPIRLQHDYALATILCTIEFPNGSTIWETPENSDDRHSCIQSGAHEASLRSHWSIQSLWKTWPHGSFRSTLSFGAFASECSGTAGVKWSWHTEQLARPPPVPGCVDMRASIASPLELALPLPRL
jgi:hypothetical protein